MRGLMAMTTLFLATALFSGCSKKPEELGLAFSGEVKADHVQFLVDETWEDSDGIRQVRQEIFDEVFNIIDEAEQFVLVDFFLVNEFLYEPGPGIRHVSQLLCDRLLEKHASNPEVTILFITDPINTVYGSVESPQFQALEAAGVQVVWTDLDRLRDSNPSISTLGRLWVKPWGVGLGNAVKNPMGSGRISVRSFLKLLNFKANHRKVVISEKSLLVTSANPHSGSSAHWNVGLRIDGAGMAMAYESESAILKLSGVEAFQPLELVEPVSATGHSVELLTERKIKDMVLALLEQVEAGDRVDLCMFYFSDTDVIQALIRAKQSGGDVRVILDPNKDAFGRTKNGIPNRQTAAKLVDVGIPVRWANTHGEQCHVKMLYVERSDATSTLLLGSCNYTRRNMDNFNCECDLALTTPADDANMQRAREVFDRWWSNTAGRSYTVDYETFEDHSRKRRVLAWWMETTGMGTF